MKLQKKRDCLPFETASFKRVRRRIIFRFNLNYIKPGKLSKFVRFLILEEGRVCIVLESYDPTPLCPDLTGALPPETSSGQARGGRVQKSGQFLSEWS
jgi:hypothetical protein